MIALFLQQLEAVFGWLLAASWQASVLALFVLLIQRVLGSRLNPRWRYALWLLVVLRLILPAVPESALSLFQFAPPPPVALTVSVSEPLFVSAPAVAPPEVRAEIPEPGHPFSIYSLLAVAWLAGVFVLFVLTWQVNRRFARQVADSPAMTNPDLWKLFVEARAELGIRRSIRLVESAQVQSPAIMGLFQPTLLLPTDVRARFDATELRFIFLHELAHLKRGDVVVQALIALLQILHWFNPVLWFVFRRMRIDREPATDALVLSRTGEQEKERYGLMLIKLLEHFNQRHSLPTLVGILEDKDQFKRRFSLIARFTRGAYGWSLLGVIVIGALAIAGLTKGHRAAFVADPALPLQLDLKPVYTKVFQRADGSDSTFRGYAGRKIIDGLPFDVGGESVLFGKSNAERGKDYPERITVPVGHTFDELHLIHAAQWRDYYGCPVAVLRFHYADGTHYDFPIRFDFQVNDWSRLYTEDEEIVADPDTKIIWRGPGGAEGLGRLFKSVVRNPFPAKKVDSLEAIAAGHNASYTLVAATLAQSDPHRDVTAGMPLVPARHFDGTLNVIVLDRNTGAPIVGAEVYPAMIIGDISLVADTVLTGANGVAPVKYPKDGAKDLRVEVMKDGYLTCDDNWNNGWQAGSIPPDVTYLLTPGRDPALDARRVTGHWKLSTGTPAGFDINQVNLYLSPKMAPPPFPPEADTPDKKRQWFQDWLKTDAGKQFIAKQRLGRMLQLKADGTFSGESVAPGEYILSGRISINGVEVLVNPRNVVIPPNPGTDPNTPADLGEIELQVPASAPVTPTTTVTPAGPDADDEAYFQKALEKDHRLIASSGIVSSTLAADARMLEAIQRGDVATLKNVLEHAVDPNTFDPDRFDSCPAFWAVHFNQPEILKLLLEHMAAGDRGPVNGSALRLAQKIHPELVPILEEGIKRNRDRLTAQLTAQMHSTHIDLPAFSNAPLQKIVNYLLEATSKVGYLERGVTIGTMDIPASTTLTFPARPNVTLWDAVQTIADANQLRFVVGQEDITLYPPKDEAMVHPPMETKNASTGTDLEPPADGLNIRNPKPTTEADPLKQDLNFGSNAYPPTSSGGTVILHESGAYHSGTTIKPNRNPAFDQTLIDVARDGRTDKVGAGDAIRIGQLIADGADPNAKNGSALVWALNFGKDDAAMVLIQNGADAHVQDSRGENAAWLAAGIYFCPGALELMIKKGVDVKSLDKKGNSIFYAMTFAPEPAAGKMNYLNDRAWTDAEFQAWQERERRTVNLLLAAGVDINGRSGPESKTPLMLAAQHGHVEMARELIAHGADVSLKDTNGETAAALAQMYGHPGLLPPLEAKPVGR